MDANFWKFVKGIFLQLLVSGAGVGVVTDLHDTPMYVNKDMERHCHESHHIVANSGRCYTGDVPLYVKAYISVFMKV